MHADDLLALDASTLSRQIAARVVSCRDLMAAALARIEALNPRFNAIVSLRDPQQLLDEASERDAQLARGERLGWMHGFPLAVKDLSHAAGLPTSMGSPLAPRSPARSDSLHVSRMRQAGAIVIGKTNTPEFGLGSHTYNTVFGTTLNAYLPTLSAGGSSGGAAVALALGMLPVADGSDMGGSLRNPAAFNNVIGFRPSRGRVPGSPDEELFLQQLGCEGPMARTVEDAARLLAVQAGFDRRVPLSLSDALPSPDAMQLDSDVKGLRIGWLGSVWPELPLAPGVRELCEGALQTFRDLGCEVEPLQLDVPREQNWTAWLRLRQLLVGGKLGAAYADPSLRERLKPEARWEIEQSLQLDAAALYQASVYRSNVYRAFLRAFETFDVVVAPTAQVFPFDAKLDWPAAVGDVTSDTYHRWMEIVTPFTLAGLPTLNVRAGFGEGGLPMGLQIAGPIHHDLEVLRLGHAYDRACGWGVVQPSVLGDLPT
ncbi:amidase [Variovorax sp. J22R115]|uniref:amidase n=1 Tax=Variovorax sp. J22R115 TaxID=3053509 RepID=UPI002577BBBF|nr:amidase [Variovorax sp. J22R115]MDM0049068.1 amidase [Variovorax sp. J22R115]